MDLRGSLIRSGTQATMGCGEGSSIGLVTGSRGKISTSLGTGRVAGSVTSCGTYGWANGRVPTCRGCRVCGVDPMNLFLWPTFLLSWVSPRSMTTRAPFLDTTL